MIPATDYIDLSRALYRLKIPCELHLFSHGPHGMSLCDTSVKTEKEIADLSMNYWTELFLKWLTQLRNK
ncbi:hypothetical protein JCM19376_39350 [Fusibacter bizertensis]